MNFACYEYPPQEGSIRLSNFFFTFLLFFSAFGGVFRTQSNIYDGAFLRKYLTKIDLTFNYFCKKAPSWIFSDILTFYFNIFFPISYLTVLNFGGKLFFFLIWSYIRKKFRVFFGYKRTNGIIVTVNVKNFKN